MDNKEKKLVSLDTRCPETWCGVFRQREWREVGAFCSVQSWLSLHFTPTTQKSCHNESLSFFDRLHIVKLIPNPQWHADRHWSLCNPTRTGSLNKDTQHIHSVSTRQMLSIFLICKLTFLERKLSKRVFIMRNRPQRCCCSLFSIWLITYVIETPLDLLNFDYSPEANHHISIVRHQYSKLYFMIDSGLFRRYDKSPTKNLLRAITN